MRSSRVYELIYTVKNLYNVFLNNTTYFSCVKICFICCFSGIWYYIQVIAIYLRKRARARALIGSTFCIYSRFRSGMQTKQEPVDSLNMFNDTLVITVMIVNVLQPNTTFYLSNL